MSSDRGIDREYVIHVYNELLLSHKKDRNNAIFSNVDGHRDDCTEYSKADRERQISYITYIESLKNVQMNLFTKQKQTHRHRNQMYACQSGKF